MHLWDARTGQEIVAFLGHTDVVRSAVFTPDGPLIVSGGWDMALRIRDGRPIEPIKGHQSP
jgi:WD40 repeat protein